MAVSTDILAHNLADVQARIAAACARVGRDPGTVRLVAVTKSADVTSILSLVALGQADLAENRPQQLAQRAAEIPASVTWHMIGHLQRNKVELIWPLAGWIHAVDSWRLLDALAAQARKTGTSPRLLLEVNVSGEASKGGLAPQELLDQWDRVRQLAELQIVGLMTMAPLTDHPETVRPVFRQLRELRDQLAARGDGLPLPELSMGMSGDFEVAIEEGATLVRVGTRLFAAPEDAQR